MGLWVRRWEWISTMSENSKRLALRPIRKRPLCYISNVPGISRSSRYKAVRSQRRSDAKPMYDPIGKFHDPIRTGKFVVRRRPDF